MTNRMTTWLLVLLRRAVRHHLLSATVVFLALAVALSLVFFQCEYPFSAPDGPYSTYGKTLRNILIFVISGFDAEAPKSLGALVYSYMLVITGIVYIGLLTAVITAKIVEVKFRRGITMSQVKFAKHILLCGWIDKPQHILEQLFAPDRKDYDPVVIIDPHIEEAPMDHPLLQVIRGDPTEAEVLRRANVQQAKAAIILADRTVSDPNLADARSLLIALAIESLQREVYTCAEVLNPANAVHFRRVNVDEVISVSEISHALVVQAALNPGVGRLIEDMLTFGEGEELYREPVPPQFIGKTFAELATELMRQRDMVLVGVETRDGQIVHTRRARWQFQEGDRIFVLSEDQPRGLERLCAAESSVEARPQSAR